jgi:hypothetical protein
MIYLDVIALFEYSLCLNLHNLFKNGKKNSDTS